MKNISTHNTGFVTRKGTFLPPINTGRGKAVIEAYTMFGVLFLLFTCTVCGFTCFRDFKRRRELREMSQETLRRRRIREAVRAKIAEVEGLEESQSFKWYIEQRNPIVHFGGIVEISPENSNSQSVTVLYSVGDNEDLSHMKKVELNLQELLTSRHRHHYNRDKSSHIQDLQQQGTSPGGEEGQQLAALQVSKTGDIPPSPNPSRSPMLQEFRASVEKTIWMARAVASTSTAVDASENSFTDIENDRSHCSAVDL